MIFSFAGHVLDTDRRVLTRGGQDVAIEPQVFDVLRVLVENTGAVVSKDELIDAVWSGRIVSEASISSRINAARTAVGDTGKDQRVIRTVQRRGFELVAPVETGARPVRETTELRQKIRYASSSDGTNIAWSSAGQGEDLLFCWHHLSHLEKDWSSDILAPGLRDLASRFRLVRYDVRGSGLSDPIRDGTTMDGHVDDLLAVADAAGLERFPIVALLQNTAVAIRFAARYPDRVSRLVLHNAYVRGRAIRENATEKPRHDPFIALLDSGGWGDPENPFMRAWATMVVPGASPEDTTELIELIANAGSPQDALVQRDLIDRLDMTGDLANVQCPTLVIHARLCGIHPVSEGRRVAAGIPDAEFLELDSASTVFFAADPVFERLQEATLAFLAEA
mgnify:CR=1 FL=1